LTVVIDPDGRERHLYYGVGWGEDLSALLDELASPPLPAASDSSDLVGQNVALLSDTKVFDWAEWELDPGVSAQTLRVFPTADLAEEYFTGAIAELESSGWISMGEETGEGTLKGAYLIHRHPDGGHVGNGYNLNVMVEVEGKSFEDTRYTLVWMGGGFCC
ncbi:MAG: hypothetical protein O3C10_10050, partial [Chloroflexi bacterium]|nr:hypothetical protein [Chloroflexota bacterium]